MHVLGMVKIHITLIPGHAGLVCFYRPMHYAHVHSIANGPEFLYSTAFLRTASEQTL